MKTEFLPSHLQKAALLLDSQKFSVYRLNVATKSGLSIPRDVVVHPGAVVILPLTAAEEVVLIANDRHAVGKTLWELPAGTREAGEQPVQTASRELIEETGYRAEQMLPLLDFYASPGFCTEKLYAFLAQNLSYVGQKLEDSEKITVHTFSHEKVLQMIRSHEIEDSKTVTTLLYFYQFIKR